MHIQRQIFAIFAIMLATVAPALAVGVLGGIVRKVDGLVDGIEGKVESLVDLSLVNSTLEDINKLSDPLLDNLADGLDGLLKKVLSGGH